MVRKDFFAPETTQRPSASSRQARIGAADIDSMFQGGTSTSLTTFNTLPGWRWSMIVFAGVLLFFGGRLVQLQFVQGSTYRAFSEGNRVRAIVTPAPRGSIVDRNGIVLADNVPNFILTIIPADLPKISVDRRSAIERIAAATSTNADDITKALQTSGRRSTDPVTIREQLTYDEAVRDMVATANEPAVSILATPNRTYPLGSAAASIIGYTGRISDTELARQPSAGVLDIVGKTGLEKQFNSVLTGQDGIQEVERDVQNRIQRLVSSRDPVPGETVVTSIDAGLQGVLNSKLQSMVAQMRSTGGAAIVLNPTTGEVLAMASAPTYDNNWFVTSGHNDNITKALTNPGKLLLNRAISGQYPSGSIVKPLLAAAALDAGTITQNSTVNSVGGFKVGNDYFPDWKAGGHGVTNVIKAIAESVNTFFYAVGGGFDNITGLGVDRIVNYLQKFGWGKKLGIDIPSEATGLLPTKDWRTTKRPSPWKLGDTYHLSIGQGDLEVTPLQIAASLSAIANGGTLLTPHVVTGIKDSAGQIVQNIPPTVITDHVVPPKVLSTVQAGMRTGVLNGSSRSLQSLPVSSAGKTGTAQFGNQGKTHSWYAAYAPYDRPQVLIVVIVEGGGEGNTAALPVAKDTLQWYFSEGAGKPKS